MYLEYSNPNVYDLNVANSRGIESPGYTISSKIEELNTQSRSKRSHYDYGIDSKGATSQKYSNIKPNYEDVDIDEDNIQEEQAFMFSLPPDDDDNYSGYSLIAGGMPQRTPMTEFDAAPSNGGDQIDMLMNAYSRPNARAQNMNSIPMSELTTSMGMNYSPNTHDIYVVNKDDNSSGFYQSGNFPTTNYPRGGQQDKFYISGAQSNYNYPGYTNEQFSAQRRATGQNRGRQLNSNIIAGQMISNNGKLILSPGNRIGNVNRHQNP